ncbi:MAG: permease [Clostridia bacterium]|nr:permease [Clostridia bacterium]
MTEIIKREAIYLLYYFEIQIKQILPYWAFGIVLGSIISVFAKNKILKAVESLNNTRLGTLGVIPASLLGIASPLCMYGTIPIAASLAKLKMREDWIGAFMMSSILLNPQLIIYSSALGFYACLLRVVFCTFGGIFAGLLIRLLFKNKSYFNFTGFEKIHNRDNDPNMLIRLLKNIWRNVKATGPYFLIGIALTAVYQRYVPQDTFASLFGENNKGFGILLAATIGVPVYVCGGGTIPLLAEWLRTGMSMGAGVSFMITGPATKITNLSALKAVLGIKHFAMYIYFIIIYSILSGFVTDYILANIF